jgi:hypothetical protein
MAHAIGKHELDRDAFIELQMTRGNDESHATAPELPLHAVLSREHRLLFWIEDLHDRRHAGTDVGSGAGGTYVFQG